MAESGELRKFDHELTMALHWDLRRIIDSCVPGSLKDQFMRIGVFQGLMHVHRSLPRIGPCAPGSLKDYFMRIGVSQASI